MHITGCIISISRILVNSRYPALTVGHGTFSSSSSVQYQLEPAVFKASELLLGLVSLHYPLVKLCCGHLLSSTFLSSILESQLQFTSPAESIAKKEQPWTIDLLWLSIPVLALFTQVSSAFIVFTKNPSLLNLIYPLCQILPSCLHLLED